MENFKILRSIGAITRRVQNDSNHRFKEIGLNNNLFIYLIRVVEQPGMFLTELSNAVQIDRTTSFRTIKKLQSQDYLILSDDPVDKKIKRVYPTKKAKDIYPLLHNYEKKCSDALLQKLTKDEMIQLEYLLSKTVQS